MQQKSFITILTATILAVSTIVVIQDTADAYIIGSTAEETTTLSLHSISQVKEGSTVEFTGKLVSGSGKPVAEAFIEIIDQSASARSAGSIAKAVTNSDGVYKATWVAESKRDSDTITVLAQFKGNDHFLGSRSDRITVTVLS